MVKSGLDRTAMSQSGFMLPALSQSQLAAVQYDLVLELRDPRAGGYDGHLGHAQHQWPEIGPRRTRKVHVENQGTDTDILCGQCSVTVEFRIPNSAVGSSVLLQQPVCRAVNH